MNRLLAEKYFKKAEEAGAEDLLTYYYCLYLGHLELGNEEEAAMWKQSYDSLNDSICESSEYDYDY